MKWIVGLLYGVFLVSLLLAGVLATETRMLLQWPAFVGFGSLGVLLVLRWKPKLFSPPADLCLGAAALFATWVVVRGTLSPVAYFAREDISLVLACLAVYLLTATHFSSPKMRAGTVWVLILLGLGNLCVGLIHLSGDWTFHILPSLQRNFEVGRIGGFFNNSDHLAAFMLTVLFLSLGMALFGRGGKAQRSLFAVVAVVSLAVILLAKSRGALLGVAAGGGALGVVILWFVWSLNRFLFKRVAIGMAGLALAGGFLIFFTYGKVVESRFKGGAPPREEVRLHIWAAAWDQHLENPMFGTGSRTHYDYCRKYRTEGMHPSITDAAFAHNEYLQLLADYGWVGVGIFLLFIVVHLKGGAGFLRWFAAERARRGRGARGARAGLVVGALATLVALLVHAVVEFHMHIPAVAIAASFCLGVMANPGFGRGARKPVRLPALRPLLKLGLAGAGAWLAYAGVRYMPAEIEMRRARITAGIDDLAYERLGMLHRVKERDPENPEAFSTAGITRLDMIRGGMPEVLVKSTLDQALIDFERAEALNPNDIFNLMNHADALAFVGLAEEAEKRLKRAMVWAPLYENVRLAWAIHLHRLGRFEEADAAYLNAKEATAYKNTNWWVGHQMLRKQMEAREAATTGHTGVERTPTTAGIGPPGDGS